MGCWLSDGLGRAGTRNCWKQSNSENLLQGQPQLQPAWVTQCSQVTGVSPAGCSSGCCGAAAGCGEGPGDGCSFCHLTYTITRKRAKQPKLSELESERLGISGLLVYKCWTHLDSCPSTSVNCSEQCFFQSGFLAVPIMTGQDPKGKKNCEGPAVTFRWLPWAINLLEQGSSLRLQRAVCLQEQQSDPQSCLCWL